MIQIKIPNNNLEERTYIIEVIFKEFLGLEYSTVIEKEAINWEIVLPDGKRIIFEDHFFNKNPSPLEYLKIENFPSKIIFEKNKFIVEKDIPVLYGTNNLKESNNQIICGIDIFASSYFMLTRWEEYVNKERDTHNRFLACNSIATKFDFLHRPIVNEYLEMLKNMMIYLDSNISFINRKFNFLLTHDVDYINKWDTPKKFLRHLVGDIIKRKSPIEFIKSIIDYSALKLNLKKDPFDTFDYLMDISERINTKSYFFFMAEGVTRYDNHYKSDSKQVKDLIEKIIGRGHFIGIHPSYNAYNKNEQFLKEKNELENNLNTKITFGREHFLRFEIPTTWQIWNDNQMDWDSTLSFADKEGFRSGTCFEFSVFNILSRKKLTLKEKPLIVMESSFLYQKDISPEQMQQSILNLLNTVKKYNGTFTILWHNSSFNIYEWKKYRKIYERVLSL